jgi:phenylacetate-CoA ligase
MPPTTSCLPRCADLAWWRARLAWWRVLASGARAAHAVSRSSLPAFRWTATHAGASAERLSAAAAVTAARAALRTVPAYRELVGDSVPATATGRTAAAWLAGLPVTTKHSYIDRWPLEARCTGGRIPDRGCELDESAGSSGAPYTWIRSQPELADVHRSLALLARHLLPADGRPIVVLNAFSMGAWATGTNVAVALRAIGTVKSCGPDVDKVLGTIDLLGDGPTYIVCGYPPFLRTLLDAATARSVDLSRLTLYGFVGGEGMTEAARARLERSFVAVWSAYGASDLDIGVAAETPVSVWLRRQAAASPELALALFGRTDRLPMVFQYDPCDYYVETVASPSGANELVVTVIRPMLSPRIRYNVGDEGGTVGFAAAMAACRRFGLDHSAAEARPFRLPFLFVHGRSDQTVSYMGANLYPEDVAAGIGDSSHAEILGAFCMELAEVELADGDGDGDGDVRPVVHVEAPPGSGVDPDELTRAIVGRLAASSGDYRAALGESPAAGDVRVRLWDPGTGPFTANAGRIKQRHVVDSGSRR